MCVCMRTHACACLPAFVHAREKEPVRIKEVALASAVYEGVLCLTVERSSLNMASGVWVLDSSSIHNGSDGSDC